MNVSIILPTNNKDASFLFTLDSVMKQTYPSEKYELVIIAKKPTDLILSAVQTVSQKIKIHLITQEGFGRANARNIGINNSSGEIILFADDDLLLSPDFIAEHVKYHKEKHQIVLGKVYQLYLSNPNKIKSLTEIFNKIDSIAREDIYFKTVRKAFDFPKNNIPWIGFGTNNSSLRRKDLYEIGLFDEEFKGWGQDNIELGYRLYKKGLKFRYNDKACNYHLAHKRDKIEMFRDIQQNLDLFYRKHPDFTISLYRDFIYGKVSLECFNSSISLGKDLRRIEEDSGKIYYKQFKLLEDWLKGETEID